MANILVLFGFSWMVAAAIIGFLLAKRHDATLVELERIAATGNLAEYHRVSDGYKWNKTVHAHAFLFSVVTVAVGLAMAKMNYSQTVSNGLATALIIAAPMWTLAALRRFRPLMAIADVLMLVSVATAAVGLARAL